MTTDDLAWVQSRLRNCTNARRQLRICAECLSVAEDTLLERLGYTSLDTFRAAHPQNKRSCGPSVERIYNPVPPEVMLESVLYYYGGAPISTVRSMMGYTQTVTPEAIRHRVCSWKKKHPTLAAGMPCKRPKPKKETEAMKMTYDEAGLPAYAYARSRYTKNIVRIVRGERALLCAVPTAWYRWWSCWTAATAWPGSAWAAAALPGSKCTTSSTASLTVWPKRA